MLLRFARNDAAAFGKFHNYRYFLLKPVIRHLLSVISFGVHNNNGFASSASATGIVFHSAVAR